MSDDYKAHSFIPKPGVWRNFCSRCGHTKGHGVHNRPSPRPKAISGLTFKLKSGRVLFLNEPMSAEELAEAQTDAGMVVLEALADAIEARCDAAISTDSPEGKAMLKKYNLPNP